VRSFTGVRAHVYLQRHCCGELLITLRAYVRLLLTVVHCHVVLKVTRKCKTLTTLAAQKWTLDYMHARRVQVQVSGIKESLMTLRAAVAVFPIMHTLDVHR